MATGHIPKRKRKRDGFIRQSIDSLRPAKVSCVEPFKLEDELLRDDSYGTRTSNLSSRPSTPSVVPTSASSTRASTPLEYADARSTEDDHTSISVFHQGGRLSVSVKRGVSGYKSSSEPPVETDFVDHDEDYEDIPNEDLDVSRLDPIPEPEKPPAKRSRKATTVSFWTIASIY